MKKNVMMRVASLLMVCVLATTCGISGTFAKYVTKAESTDAARVAKWGVKITANGEMFTTEETGTVAGASAKTVLSSNDEDVVAPGMSGSLVSVQFEGQPEVAVEVKYEATLALNYWTVDGVEYCPIVFTVAGATYGTNVTDAANKSATVADLIVAVEEAIEDYTAEYAAGYNLAGEADLAVAWAWAFETGADAAEKAANDIKDTALGDKAAAGTAPEIALTVVSTVTQID